MTFLASMWKWMGLDADALRLAVDPRLACHGVGFTPEQIQRVKLLFPEIRFIQDRQDGSFEAAIRKARKNAKVLAGPDVGLNFVAAAMRAIPGQACAMIPAPLPYLDGPGGELEGYALDLVSPWPLGEIPGEFDQLLEAWPANGHRFTGGSWHLSLEAAGEPVPGSALVVGNEEQDRAARILLESVKPSTVETMRVPPDWHRPDFQRLLSKALDRNAQVVCMDDLLLPRVVASGRPVLGPRDGRLFRLGLVDAGPRSAPISKLDRRKVVCAFLAYGRYLHRGKCVQIREFPEPMS